MKCPAVFKFQSLRNVETVRLEVQVGPHRDNLLIAEVDRKELASVVALADIRNGEDLLVKGNLVTR